jgi:hypothetical protein
MTEEEDRPPKVEAHWLACTDGAVRRLAEEAYRRRLLPLGTLDEETLGLLADALADAGCADESILDHLRGPGPHVPGCWAVDALAGRAWAT